MQDQRQKVPLRCLLDSSTQCTCWLVLLQKTLIYNRSCQLCDQIGTTEALTHGLVTLAKLDASSKQGPRREHAHDVPAAPGRAHVALHLRHAILQRAQRRPRRVAAQQRPGHARALRSTQCASLACTQSTARP